ncbi:uncharacterized protein SOCE26_077050 [Sorangium cellulosum]|uniref:Uncharacterized protein n=1 Tax=Sorangium cellulosum TaxID=56 RepID=A0A2L0F3R0_SORCE|nr:hypothetical protein [Sorangium cellulosum]AUX46200.1 uncharacterized protein SOCE26_077050 [Sorangium cellulosum]
MAEENDLPWPTLAEVCSRVSEFLDPVLCGEEGIWEPSRWAWRRG